MDITRDEIVRRTSFRKSPTFSEKTPTFFGKAPTFFGETSEIIPNRSLDRYRADRYGEDNFLASFIFLLASCFSSVLDVACYAFTLTENNLFNNQIKICAESNDRFGDNFFFYRTFCRSYKEGKIIDEKTKCCRL